MCRRILCTCKKRDLKTNLLNILEICLCLVIIIIFTGLIPSAGLVVYFVYLHVRKAYNCSPLHSNPEIVFVKEK